MLDKNRFFLLPLIFVIISLHAEPNTTKNWGGWGNFGLGGSLATVHTVDINLKAGLSTQLYRFMTGYRYMRGQEIFRLWISPLEHINEHSFLFGYSFCQNKYFSLITSAGPSIIHGIQRDSVIQSIFLENTIYSTKKYVTSGVSFELLFIYKMKRYLGFGTSLNANYNKVNSYYGLTGNFYFGKLCR